MFVKQKQKKMPKWSIHMKNVEIARFPRTLTLTRSFEVAPNEPKKQFKKMPVCPLST